jgi:hypothetical protein
MAIANINCQNFGSSGGGGLVGYYAEPAPEGWYPSRSYMVFKVDLSSLPPNIKMNSGTFYLTGYRRTYGIYGTLYKGNDPIFNTGSSLYSWVYFGSTSKTTNSFPVSVSTFTRELLSFYIYDNDCPMSYSYGFYVPGTTGDTNYLKLDYTMYRPISDGALGGFLNFIVLPKIIPRMVLGLGEVIY